MKFGYPDLRRYRRDDLGVQSLEETMENWPTNKLPIDFEVLSSNKQEILKNGNNQPRIHQCLELRTVDPKDFVRIQELVLVLVLLFSWLTLMAIFVVQYHRIRFRSPVQPRMRFDPIMSVFQFRKGGGLVGNRNFAEYDYHWFSRYLDRRMALQQRPHQTIYKPLKANIRLLSKKSK